MVDSAKRNELAEPSVVLKIHTGCLTLSHWAPVRYHHPMDLQSIFKAPLLPSSLKITHILLKLSQHGLTNIPYDLL